MAKIAVIGDKDSILAFKALGIDVFTPTEANEARKTVHHLANNDYGIIFITEEIASQIKETITKFEREFIPAIIPIPSSKGTLQIGMKRIDENVEKAVGINLFADEKR